MRRPAFLRREPAGDGNLVPLVNVVFLLMLFFVIAGRIAPTPEGAVELAASTREPVATVVDADLQIDAGGQLVDSAGTPVAPSGLPPDDGTLEGTLTIRVDRRAPAAEVAAVLAAIEEAGVPAIELVVETR